MHGRIGHAVRPKITLHWLEPGAPGVFLAFDLGVPIVNLGRERNQRARCDHDENDLAHACSPENPSSDGARR